MLLRKFKRVKLQKFVMSLGFPIDIDEDEEADTYHSPKVFTGEAENATGYSAFTEAENATESSSFPGAENVTGPSAFTGAENATGPSAGASENEYPGSQQTHKQGCSILELYILVCLRRLEVKEQEATNFHVTGHVIDPNK
uniref:Uncharacterized protein isoform X4 n=1 Tax=Nicotiana tabacum TaxID=4097 RepID=A0A1S4DB24_TOBAC|nr:PREDICTED: uncharacterized protein LOC107827731 isoform X4 [Nicotiana tabacum]